MLFSIAPWAGYTIVNNLVLGANFEYSYGSSKRSSSNSTFKSNSVFLAPFIRYYLNQGLFFQSQYGFGPSKYKSDVNGVITENDGNSFILRWGVGYAARISDTVLFEPTMGYYASGSSDSSTRSGLYVMGGFTIILKTVQ